MGRDDTGEAVATAMRRDDGAVMCSCGDRLADRIEGDAVVIDGMEYRFRRRNDTMTCRTCGFEHPVWQFRRDPSLVRIDTGERRRSSD